MIKSYYIHKCHVAGHGARVFLHETAIRSMLEGTHCCIDQLPWKGETTNPVANVLRENILWGGADRDYSDWYGYETCCAIEEQERALFRIEETLRAEGFTKLDKAPWDE